MRADSLVCVVDDDEAMRLSIESLFGSVGQRVLTFKSTQEFSETLLPDLPACLVLDVRLPGQSGLEFQQSLAKTGKALPIVFITGHGDIPMSVAAMKAGAIEFLTKPFRHQDLLDAVNRGLQIDRERRTNGAEIEQLRSRFQTLTQREREVMSLVVAGRLNKQIANELGLSEVTVKAHRSQVMHKMHAKSLPDLVRSSDKLAFHSISPPRSSSGS